MKDIQPAAFPIPTSSDTTFEYTAGQLTRLQSNDEDTTAPHP